MTVASKHATSEVDYYAHALEHKSWSARPIQKPSCYMLTGGPVVQSSCYRPAVLTGGIPINSCRGIWLDCGMVRIERNVVRLSRGGYPRNNDGFSLVLLTYLGIDVEYLLTTSQCVPHWEQKEMPS